VTPELLKLLILPGILAAAAILAVLAERHAMPATAIWISLVGWLLASTGLTFLARESQRWPAVGYLQNLAVFLGLCAVPFVVAYGANAWMHSRRLGPALHLGVTLGLALLAILPAGIVAGPYWVLFLRSMFGGEYIRYP
jgi:hypothetical protein